MNLLLAFAIISQLLHIPSRPRHQKFFEGTIEKVLLPSITSVTVFWTLNSELYGFYTSCTLPSCLTLAKEASTSDSISLNNSSRRSPESIARLGTKGTYSGQRWLMKLRKKGFVTMLKGNLHSSMGTLVVHVVICLFCRLPISCELFTSARHWLHLRPIFSPFGPKRTSKEVCHF